MTAAPPPDCDQPRRIVIVGAGQAACSVARTLRAEGFAGALTMISADAHPPYDRPPLSKAILLGEAAAESAALFPGDVVGELAIDLRLGAAATAIDRDRRQVTISGGGALAYDRLVIATGGRARRLRIPGAELPDALYLRTLDDSLALGARLRAARHLLVVGGGWIGLEVASSARALGLAVTVLEAGGRLCGRAAPPVLGAFLLDLHRRHGVTVRLGATLASLAARHGGGIVARFAEGGAIEADLALIGIGMVPNDELARAAGLDCHDGVVTDAAGRTADPCVFACGDVAAFAHPGWALPAMRIESWSNAQLQGAACAFALLGGAARRDEVPWFWSDQFGVNIQIVGAPDHDAEPIRRGNADTFSLFWLRDGRISAAISVGAPRDMTIARRLAAAGAPVSAALLGDPAADLRKLLRLAA